MTLIYPTGTSAPTPRIAPGERIALLGPPAEADALLRRMARIMPDALLLTGEFLGLDDDTTGWENVRTRLGDGYEAEAASAFCGLGGLLGVRVRHYSRGMRWRLGFTLATAAPPGVLLVGPGTWGGDLGFRGRVRERMRRLALRAGRAVIAGADPGWRSGICTRTIRIRSGSQETQRHRESRRR
jgi:ABC-type polysaccharide/polyol phosphate transport system ATPase subunit